MLDLSNILTPMEYDNDKLRKRTPRLEVFYWVVLILLQPVTCSIIFFPAKPLIGLLLLAVSMLVFPAYMIYARIAGPALPGEPKTKKYHALLGSRWFIALLTVLSFLVIQAFLLAVYSLFLKFRPTPVLQAYLVPTTGNLLREGWWSVVNMALAI